MSKHSIVRWIKMIGVYLLVAAVAALGWLWCALPEEVYLEPEQTLTLPRFGWVEPLRGHGSRNVASTRAAGSYQTTLALGGWLPVKTIRATVMQRPTVTVCGTPFGVKMFSEGALVVGFSEVHTAAGTVNPAKQAGLRLGDRVIRMGNTVTETNEQVHAALEAAAGAAVEVVYVRKGEQRQTTLLPVWDTQNAQWRAGMWVRDSSAGVGTLTFVDAQAGVFAGLGHPISDSDTGEQVALRSGEIVACQIVGCTGGTAGSPGELKGKFLSDHALGRICINGENGVYGTVSTAIAGQQTELAFAQEVLPGAAENLPTVGLRAALFRQTRWRYLAKYHCRSQRQKSGGTGRERAAGAFAGAEGDAGADRRHRAGNERQSHPAKRAAGGCGDPCAGQRPDTRLRYFCTNHAGTGTFRARNGRSSIKKYDIRAEFP